MQNGRVQRQLSRKEEQDLRNRRTGLLFFQLSWILVFLTLVLAYFQIRGQSVTWPPPGVDKPSPIIPTAVTIGLIASSVVLGRAAAAAKDDRIASFLSQWRIAIGLGALFVLIMAYEWLAMPIGDEGQYGLLFRVLVGFHGIHALVIGVFLVRIYRNGQQYGSANFWPVEAAVGLWNFVTIAWILFYLVLFWL